jgi:hypothetical protein
MFAAACCFGGGFWASALGVHLHQIVLVYLGYGVLGGIGLGLGYISPVSTLIKWFPDRPGMTTGLAETGRIRSRRETAETNHVRRSDRRRGDKNAAILSAAGRSVLERQQHTSGATCVLLVIAWLWVGVPLGWGISRTVVQAVPLFETAPQPADTKSAPAKSAASPPAKSAPGGTAR